MDVIIGSLFGAWFLTLFDFDKMVIEVLQPHVSVMLTSSHYYMLAVVVGILLTLLKR